MLEARGYLVASLCLGWVAVWASENLFWITPAPDLRIVELFLVWIAYSVAAGAALSAVIWTGLGGWPAAFLGGALLGFAIEGALVSTMYDAFPAQLVWTPLAWHALISGLAVLCGSLALMRGGLGLQLAGLAALGLFGATWGLYWPLEGKPLAGIGGLLLYLGLAGAGVALALWVASRVELPRQGRWWLWVAPAVVAMVWAGWTVAAPSPVRLAGPALTAVTVWAMRRLGRAGPSPDLGPPLQWSRAILFPLAPVLTALAVSIGWRSLGGVAVNIPIALATGAAGLALWLWLVARAVRVSR